MKLNRALYDRFLEKAGRVFVENVTIGLGYTAVCVSDGGLGLAATFFAGKKPASLNRDYVDYEGRPAEELLKHIFDDRMVHRGMALALINALNHRDAAALPESPGNRFLVNALGVERHTRVAMVGFFRPLAEMMKADGVSIEIMDQALEIGDRKSFYESLSRRTDVLILTSTSILNNTAEEILEQAGEGVKVMMMGPSTPLVADVFGGCGVSMLAGAVPGEKEMLLRAVRHGTGTPVIKKFCRRVYCPCS